MSRKLAELGIKNAPGEETPLVKQLLAVIERQQKQIEKLMAEINRLKGLPELPVRPSKPSSLLDSMNPPSKQDGGKHAVGKGKKKRKGKRWNNRKGSKLRKLVIDKIETIELELLAAAPLLRSPSALTPAGLNS